MTYTKKRLLVRLRKSFSLAWGVFWSNMSFENEIDTGFRKKPPIINRNEHSRKEIFQLSPKEKLYIIEKEFYKLRKRIEQNERRDIGRLTREQTYYLCMLKREKDSLERGPLY